MRSSVVRMAKVLVFLAVAASAAPAWSAVLTWSGTGATVNWSDSNNWGGTSPVDGSDLFFTGSLQQSNTNDFFTNVGEVTFNSANFSTAGNPLTLNGESGVGILALNTTGTNTWGIATTLGVAPVIFTNTYAASSLVLANTINNNGNLLTLNGSGSFTFQQALSGGGGLALAGAGTTTLSSQTYTGATIVNQGAYVL